VGGGRSGKVAQTIYIHVCKCKNNKIKERKNKRMYCKNRETRTIWRNIRCRSNGIWLIEYKGRS
jgi:hypothetical protein